MKQKSPHQGGLTYDIWISSDFVGYWIGAQEGTRTPTVSPPLGPEPSASTNSATWATGSLQLVILLFGQILVKEQKGLQIANVDVDAGEKEVNALARA